MSETARLILDNQEIEIPVITGSENEKALDISKLRASTGYITLDPGFKNTGSTKALSPSLTVRNPRYRGYAIEDLAEKALPRSSIPPYLRRATKKGGTRLLH